jgi:hypothetical protein
VSSWKALARGSQPCYDNGAVAAEASKGRFTLQDQHGTMEGTVVTRPGVTEGTVLTRPGVTEGTVLTRPGVTEGTTVQGGGLESVFGDKVCARHIKLAIACASG